MIEMFKWTSVHPPLELRVLEALTARSLIQSLVPYRAHVVEPESLLPRTEQGAPQWISLKTGAQGTSELT